MIDKIKKPRVFQNKQQTLIQIRLSKQYTKINESINQDLEIERMKLQIVEHSEGGYIFESLMVVKPYFVGTLVIIIQRIK